MEVFSVLTTEEMFRKKIASVCDSNARQNPCAASLPTHLSLFCLRPLLGGARGIAGYL